MIDVLLATYRPDAQMLKAQVDSIRAQQGVDVNLICREDTEGLGAAGNFSALLAQSEAAYVAFSDQDDVWLPEKLSKAMARMAELEEKYGKDVPLLVFTDGYVTDATLTRQPGTIVSRQGVRVNAALRFSRLLMQNFVPGNAMLFNAALRARAGAVPPEALMHDVWMLLVAAAFGHVAFVDEPLFDYRQHGANAVGATRAGTGHFLRRLGEGRRAFRERLMRNVRMAEAFVRRFGDAAPEPARALAGFGRMGAWSRRRALIRHRLFKCGVLRNLALLLFA